MQIDGLLQMMDILEPFIFDWVSDKKGSISAEHGLGQMKNDKILYSKTPQAVSVMQNLKSIFDPHGIMNPYKLLPTIAS